MPIPTPNKGEKKKDFISRCMSDPVMKREYPKKAGEKRAEQRLAICYQKWEDKDKKTEQVEVPAAALSFSATGDAIQFADAGEGKRRQHVLASTGQALTHWWWGRMAFDLSGMRAFKDKIPALREHDTERPVGWFDEFSTQEKGFYVSGPFVDTDDARELQKLHDQGFPLEASIRFMSEGARIEDISEGAKAEVNGFTFQGPGKIVRECAIREVSWCVLGADNQTSAQALADGSEKVTVTIEKGDEQMELTDEERRDLALEHVASLSAEQLAELPGIAELRDASVAAGRESERTRVKMCADSFKTDPAFALKAYLEGKDLKDARIEHAEARAKAAEEAAKKLAEQTPGSGQEAAGFAASDSEEALAAKKAKAEAKAGNADPQALVAAKLAEFKAAGLTVVDAWKRIVAEDPDLHKAYLAEVNAG